MTDTTSPAGNTEAMADRSHDAELVRVEDNVWTTLTEIAQQLDDPFGSASEPCREDYDLMKKAARSIRAIHGRLAALAAEAPKFAAPSVDSSAAARDTARLAWLADNANAEITHSGWDGEDEWRVHTVNGGRNDREWTLRGAGETPGEAIDAAMISCAADKPVATTGQTADET